MAKIGGNKVPEITGAEHISPEATGDNISAKRVANYVWNDGNSAWERMSRALSAGQDFDYVEVTNPDDVTEVYTFKMGGSGGTTVQTITVVYVDNTKADIANVTWS